MAEIHGRVSGGHAGRNRGKVSPGALGLSALHGFLPCRRAKVPEGYGEPRAGGVEYLAAFFYYIHSSYYYYYFVYVLYV